MNPKKAFRKFGDAIMRAPQGAQLTVGLTWVENKGWRVMMQVHTHVLMLGSKDARGLADTYAKHQQDAERSGLAWVAPELRSLADEADQKNVDRVQPEGMIEHVTTHGSA